MTTSSLVVQPLKLRSKGADWGSYPARLLRFSTVDRATDPAYLLYQYGTTDTVDTRIEAHQRYSERPDDYLNWVLHRLDPHPGDLALDVGCGKGRITRC